MQVWGQQVKAGFAALLGYSGVSVKYEDEAGRTYTPKVLFSEPTTDVQSGMQLSDDYAIEYDSDHLPGLQHDSMLIINQHWYKVRTVHKAGDGFTYRASLSQGDPL